MKKLSIILFLILFSTLIFSLVAKGIKGNPTANDMKGIVEFSLRDRGRFMLTENLVHFHTFRLTRTQADLAAPDVGYYDGHWYELYPPGISVLAIPFYIVGSYFNLSLFFTFIMGGLFAIGTLIFTFLISKKVFRLPNWASMFAAIAFGFASTSMGYATSLFQHHATAFFIVSTFYATYKYKNKGKWSFLWSLYVWGAYGVMMFIDYPNALLMLPVMVYLCLSAIEIKNEGSKHKVKIRNSLLLTSLLFIMLTITHGYYNKVNFGGWTRISGSLVGYREGIQNVVDQNTNQVTKDQIDSTVKDPANFFKESKFITGARVLLVSSDRGLFVYSPIFIIALLGILLSSIKRNIDLEKSVLIALIAVTLFFYSSFGDPWAGFSFGPRYLIPIMPILAIFGAYFLTNVRWKFLARVAAFILVGYSSAIALLGALTTNAVPPIVEAVSPKYGIAFNIDLLKRNKSLSFMYNNYFSHEITLIQYYWIILIFILLIFFIVLIIMPKFEKKDYEVIN